MSDRCPDGLLPDGPVCPRCGGHRGPSGIDGGTWVHYTPAPNELARIARAARERSLDERTIAAWIRSQMERGGFDPERLPELMARYALMTPEAARAEFAKRMQLNDEESEP